MKKRPLSAFIIVVILLTLLVACGKEGSPSQAADVYLEMAQDYIDKSDYDSAAEVLQKGLDATGNEQIAALLKEVLALQLSQSNSDSLAPDNTSTEDSTPTVDNSKFLSYSGTWAEDEIGWLAGGLILDLSVSDTVMSINGTYVQAAPESRVASIHVNIELSNIQSNYITAEFSDDGWGNAGTLAIQFSSEKLECYIQDTHYVGNQGFPIWGISEGWFSLFRNNEAHDALSYTMDQYYELFPEEDPDYYEEQPQTYDTSKASGILAALGVTEDEFRANCTPLQRQEGPSGNVWTYENDYLMDMLNYPAQYANSWFRFLRFRVEYKNLSSDGYPCYTCEMSNPFPGIRIYDFRDDIYSPTISTGNYLSAYAIFRGIQTDDWGDDYLVFWLISCEKTD